MCWLRTGTRPFWDTTAHDNYRYLCDLGTAGCLELYLPIGDVIISIFSSVNVLDFAFRFGKHQIFVFIADIFLLQSKNKNVLVLFQKRQKQKHCFSFAESYGNFCFYLPFSFSVFSWLSFISIFSWFYWRVKRLLCRGKNVFIFMLQIAYF